MSNKPLPLSKLLPLSLQHMFAMFGATILVPLLTGLNPATALFTSATGTLLFHLITGGQVPAYLGSSFAFIAPIQLVAAEYGFAAAAGACIFAGLLYVLTSGIIKLVGLPAVQRIIPPVVVGPVIMTIGLGLAGTAKTMAEVNITIAMVTLLAVIIISIFAKGFLKLIPILSGIALGYGFTLLLQWQRWQMGIVNLGTALGGKFGARVAALSGKIMPAPLIDFSAVKEAPWFALPRFVSEGAYKGSGGIEFLLPRFELAAILIIAPIAIVTMVEHLGDMLAISRTVEKDFLAKPGLHRTLLGDGLATSWAAFLGGPPNTTYGENIGVLALTRVFNPLVLQLAAGLVLLFSLSPKVGELLATIPQPVMGGIVILLFGMIAAVGIRTLVENQVDLNNVRNLIIVSIIIIFGISGLKVLGLVGMGLGAITGILLNLILPDREKDKAVNPEN